MKYFQIWGPGRAVSVAITATCELAFILFGVEQGIAGILITGEDFLNQFGHPTGSWLGFIVSIYTLGCFFGCVVNFFTADLLGRRRTIAIAMIIIQIGVALQCTSYHVPQLMIGRFITGLGTGMETSSVPMFQSEHAPPHLRGRLVCSEALFVGIGLTIAYFMNYGFTYIDGPVAWRVPLALQSIFVIIVFLLTFTIPESPRYLYLNGYEQQSLEVLAYVAGKDTDHPDIVKNYKEIEEAVALETADKVTLLGMFRKDNARSRLRILLAYFTQFSQQWSGINLVNYYITTVLLSIGLDHNLSMILGGIAVVLFTIGSCVPAFFADRIGRRLPLVYGSFGCFVCFLVITILLNFQGNERCGQAAVAFFFLFQLIFGLGANCIPWLTCGELVPLKYRGKGNAFAVSGNWLHNFIIVEITPSLIDAGTRANKQGLSYLPFVFTNFLFVFQYYFFYPETRNLTLERIDDLFLENKTLFMGLIKTEKYLEKAKSQSSTNSESILNEEKDMGLVEHIEERSD